MKDVEPSSIAVLIPALNEAATIAQVVARAAEVGVPVVINDGSSDDTPHRARQAGAHVITLSANEGYERALSHGMRYAVERGFAFCLTMDADGQHGIESARQLIQEMGSANDVLIGVRTQKQRAGEVLAGWVGAWLWKVSDPFSGLKLYRLSSCAGLGPFDRYTLVGAEMFVRACRSGLKVGVLPIDTHQRQDAPRYGASFSANWRLFKALVVLCALYFGWKR